MAKKQKGQNEVHVIWVIAVCLILYAAICFFNGPDYQQELAQEDVRKIAGCIAAAWFFISIIIVKKQGFRVVFFRSKKKAQDGPVIPAAAVPRTGGAPSAGEQESIILKDPATGAERLFYRDPEDGSWVSEDGSSVLDPDRVSQWKDQRSDDRKWVDQENEKLKNREGWQDRKLKKEHEDFMAEEARLEEEYAVKLKNLEKYGSYTDDPEVIRRIIKRNQELELLNSKIQSSYGNMNAFMENSFTLLSKVCDYGVDVLAEFTGPAGKYLVRNVYIAGRNAGSRWSEAVNYGGNEEDALWRAGYDSLFDMAQASAGDKYKMIANVGGDAAKGAMDAYEKGESIVGGALEGTVSGYARTKAGQLVDKGFGALSKSYMSGEVKKLDVLRGQLSSGQISQNVYKGIRQVQMSHAAQNVRLINKGAKTVVGDMVDDLTKWVLK